VRREQIGIDTSLHRLGHREQRRERPDVDGQLGDLAVLAEAQDLDQLRVC
jgi:hypothetical protein